MTQNRRTLLFQWAIYGAFAILFIRCFYLQVWSGSVYRKHSERNHIRQMSIMASRGRVFDRYGKLLVDNRPSYSLFLVPVEFRKHPLGAEMLSKFTGMTVEEIERRIAEKVGGGFRPVRLIRDMDFETLSRVEENRLDLPGLFFQVEPVRMYPGKVGLGHVLGYLGEINEQELQEEYKQGYRRGDIIGKSGVEKSYEVILKGRKGVRYAEVDVLGREVGNFGGDRDVVPIPGRNIMLSIDADLQERAEELMEGSRGAVVILDPRNGGILALISKPDYSLEPFARSLSPEVWKRLTDDPEKPLLHRAIQAQLPPGSTYKLILAMAALENNFVDTKKQTFCPGYFLLGNRVFDCWKPEGHGAVAFLDAIVYSCNVYFYHLGLHVGIDHWSSFGQHLGFGQRTGIDLTSEMGGLLPDRRYLDKKYGRGKWGKGMIANLSIGQGDLLVTPIQMAVLASTIAMQGEATTPQLVRAVQDEFTGTWRHRSNSPRRDDFVSPETYRMLIEGMSGVVNRTGGTGWSAAVSGIECCGKTGTAENPQGEPHSWFIGFGPRENPKIAMAVCVENGGSGGGVAAPIGGRLLRWFFQEKHTDDPSEG